MLLFLLFPPFPFFPPKIPGLTLGPEGAQRWLLLCFSPLFSIFPPKSQDLPWARRDPQARQRLGLQKDPGKDGKVEGLGSHGRCGIWDSGFGVLGCGVWGVEWGIWDPWEAVIPNLGTYGGPGQPLKPGEAPVPLQAALAGLACLAFVTAWALGTLQGGHSWSGVGPIPNRDPKPGSQAGIPGGMCGNHSPASPERQRGRRDPWDPEHPVGERSGVISGIPRHCRYSQI